MLKIQHLSTHENLDEIILKHKQIFSFPELRKEIETKHAIKNQKTFTLKIKKDLENISHNRTKRVLLGECIKQDLIIYNLVTKKNIIDHDKLQLVNHNKRMREIAIANMVRQTEIIANIDKQLEQRDREFERQMAECECKEIFYEQIPIIDSLNTKLPVYDIVFPKLDNYSTNIQKDVVLKMPEERVTSRQHQKRLRNKQPRNQVRKILV